MIKKIITIILIMGLAVWGTAFGNDFNDRPQRGFGPPPEMNSASGEIRPEGFHPRPPRSPLDLLGRYQHENIVLEVLAEITGQSAEALSETMKTQHMREILESYGIEKESFEAAVDAKAVSLIQKSVENGSITQEQADDIVQKIEERPEPPESDTAEL